MNDREFFVERWRLEYPGFLRVYRALPEGRLDYSPHPGSRTARRIAWGLAEEVRSLNEIIQTGESRWEDRPAPESAAELAGGLRAPRRAPAGALGNARRREVGLARPLLRGRSGRLRGADPRSLFLDPLRRHPPQGPALHVHSSHGREGPRDLRTLGRRGHGALGRARFRVSRNSRSAGTGRSARRAPRRLRKRCP